MSVSLRIPCHLPMPCVSELGTYIAKTSMIMIMGWINTVCIFTKDRGYEYRGIDTLRGAEFTGTAQRRSLLVPAQH